MCCTVEITEVGKAGDEVPEEDFMVAVIKVILEVGKEFRVSVPTGPSIASHVGVAGVGVSFEQG